MHITRHIGPLEKVTSSAVTRWALENKIHFPAKPLASPCQTFLPPDYLGIPSKYAFSATLISNFTAVSWVERAASFRRPVLGFLLGFWEQAIVLNICLIYMSFASSLILSIWTRDIHASTRLLFLFPSHAYTLTFILEENFQQERRDGCPSPNTKLSQYWNIQCDLNIRHILTADRCNHSLPKQLWLGENSKHFTINFLRGACEKRREQHFSANNPYAYMQSLFW